MAANKIIKGDIREVSPSLPDQSVHCIVTSPSYWRLRDYKHEDQIGHESTPEGYTSPQPSSAHTHTMAQLMIGS